MAYFRDHYTTGRGAQINPANRFIRQEKGEDYHEDPDEDPDQQPDKKSTKFIEIHPKTIVNKVKSPDIGMAYSVNPYQGCEHGCTYCYARPTHEYWGYSAGMDFEQTILVKKNAPELLEQTIRKKSWEVKPISLSGNTDCYQPCERDFQITRQLLEIMLKYKHPVSIITKNALVLRDLDILKELAALQLTSVQISITSLHEDTRRRLEPRTATAQRKLETVKQLAEAGIPVNVFFAPVIPAINDHEVFHIAKAAKKYGANSIYYQVVRLNGPNEEIFTDWLTRNYPERTEKVLNQIRELHGGKVSDSRFSVRMKGEGNYAETIRRQMEIAKNRYFPDSNFPSLRCDLFEIPDETGQLSLFE